MFFFKDSKYTSKAMANLNGRWEKSIKRFRNKDIRQFMLKVQEYKIIIFWINKASKKSGINILIKATN